MYLPFFICILRMEVRLDGTHVYNNYFELISFEAVNLLTKVKSKTEKMLNAQLSKQVVVTFLE